MMSFEWDFSLWSLETIDKAIEDAEAQKAKSFADQGEHQFVIVFLYSSWFSC